ncbi:PLP-dependent aminotransferase family protein [Mycolicibacterium sp. 3033]|nr:PLP-dependent aminotransferase family protein [Mycolicibacterium aurantiacum]
MLVPGRRGAKETVIAALRDAARSGRLPPGTMLPASRTLAADLGLARNTVADAYADLVAEGWFASRQGAGTWVLNTAQPATPTPPRGQSVVPVHNLMPGSPDVSEFPRSRWIACTRRALIAAPNSALHMGDPRGRIELRSALADYLGRARGVRTSPESIVICAGVRQGVELLTRVLGGPIAVEAYGLHLFRDAITAAGGSTVPIGVDGHGAVVDELEGLDVAGVLLTPAHHNPLGMPLHAARRTAVVEWARRTSRVVLDDDYDGEFRFDRQPVGALQALDPGRVVYLGSVSKSLSPALRLGWLALPEALVQPVVEAAGGQQFSVDVITQLTLADFVSHGYYDRHIRRMRGRYRRRRDALVSALTPFDVGTAGLAAGLNLLVTLPNDTEAEVMRRAGEAGIALTGLSILRHPDTEIDERDGIVVGYAAPPEHAFAAAISAFCQVLAATGL